MITHSQRVIAKLEAERTPGISRRARRKAEVALAVARRHRARYVHAGAFRRLNSLRHQHRKFLADTDAFLAAVRREFV